MSTNEKRETWDISVEPNPPLMLASPFYDILDDTGLIVARVASRTDADRIIADHEAAQRIASRCCCNRGFHVHGGMGLDPKKAQPFAREGGKCPMCLEHNDDFGERLEKAVDRINELELAARIAAQRIEQAEAERDKWALKVLGLEQLVRDMDMQAQKDTDEEGTITGYRFNTGAWHRLLGVLAGAAIPAYIQLGLAANKDQAQRIEQAVEALAEAERALVEINLSNARLAQGRELAERKMAEAERERDNYKLLYEVEEQQKEIWIAAHEEMRLKAIAIEDEYDAALTANDALATALEAVHEDATDANREMIDNALAAYHAAQEQKA